MKYNLIYSGLIALVVTAFTLGGYHYFQEAESKVVRIEHVNEASSKKAILTLNEDGNVVPLDFTQTADKVLEAVVHIKSTQTFNGRRGNAPSQRQPQQLPDPFKDFFKEFGGESPQSDNGPQVKVGTGSGVIINQGGYIITNNHVIADADDLEVSLHDNRTFKASVVGTDPATDLALIQIKAQNLPTVPLVNSDEIKVGEWVLAVGNPLGLNSTVTAGIVSAKGRNINLLKEQFAVESFIQTDAAINPGNSGGALVNLEGGLVGINTAIASPTGSYAGYGFAIPANIVNKVIEDLLTYGMVQRGVLGVMIRNVDGNFAKEKELNRNTGVYVDELASNSAAAVAGIEAGDIIISVDDHEVHTSPELQAMIAQYRPGDALDITIDRKGKEMTFTVSLNNREGGKTILEKEEAGIMQILGASLETLDKKTAEELKVVGGVIIKELHAGKLRKDTNMRQGFIITKIDGQIITSKEELLKILKGKKGGVMLEGVYPELPGEYYYALGLNA